MRDEIANIARRTSRCADIEVLVDHPAIDPENGARMDVRISKPGVQNADELIDVQVGSSFCVEAAGLVGKAATIAESKKQTKYRPAVVTPAIFETHSRMGLTLKAFLAMIAPDDQQARATWLQEAMRRISCLPDPQRAHHRQMQRHHLTPCLLSLARCALFLAPVLCNPCLLAWASPHDLVDLAWYSWCPGEYPGYDSGPLKSSHIVVLWSLIRPMCAELPEYTRMPPWLVVLAWRH